MISANTIKYSRPIPVLILLLTVCLLLLSSCSGDGEKKGAIRVGDRLSPFAGIDLEGKTFSLATHAGKPVIVRFFLINCPYCKADTPAFNRFYDTYRQKGLEIVYVNNNAGDVNEVKNFADELNIAFPVIYDPEGSIAARYNVKVQPLTLVLSPEHTLLAALLGGVSPNELSELLGKYLDN